MMMISFLLQLVVISCKISCSSGYVIPMSVMADMLSTNNVNSRNIYNVLNGNKHGAAKHLVGDVLQPISE